MLLAIFLLEHSFLHERCRQAFLDVTTVLLRGDRRGRLSQRIDPRLSFHHKRMLVRASNTKNLQFDPRVEQRSSD